MRRVVACAASGPTRNNVPMTKNWTPLAITWLVLAIVGLVGTWTFNTLAVIQLRDFIGDWVNSGPAVSSLTVDLLVVAVAGCILIVVESRRLGMKRAWLYIVLSGITAFAFTFPLFLAMRERTLEAARNA
ncbi:hypothetical protein GCM10007382_00610 [Salinibacterium xinjiangense]|uniref:DUF2834 domain-containing protein n=2 Tax=Salinibacterium xinjiangense TaxID=386302 RepID=A0A2C9A387_9MICO|nr:hypothetical protein GCM10007382_00610 [Salinibacterium xinjiangense]SOE73899.1 Protein of unknown function [Salinibacterium xinjiangense]